VLAAARSAELVQAKKLAVRLAMAIGTMLRTRAVGEDRLFSNGFNQWSAVVADRRGPRALRLLELCSAAQCRCYRLDVGGAGGVLGRWHSRVAAWRAADRHAYTVRHPRIGR
jgi:hypothetical protein